MLISLLFPAAGSANQTRKKVRFRRRDVHVRWRGKERDSSVESKKQKTLFDDKSAVFQSNKQTEFRTVLSQAEYIQRLSQPHEGFHQQCGKCVTKQFCIVFFSIYTCSRYVIKMCVLRIRLMESSLEIRRHILSGFNINFNFPFCKCLQVALSGLLNQENVAKSATLL